MMWWIVLLVVAAIIIYFSIAPSGLLDVRGRSVFISGCDTGFGYGLALRLDKLGMRVFAGCLTQHGAEALRVKASTQLVTILCDITKEQDVQNAEKVVAEQSPEGLWCLVNNAGVAFSGEWDWVPMNLVRKTMEVNFFGHVIVSKAFLPLLKKYKGRIVNITSIAGVVAPSGLGPYSASKFAMEAFSDSLRREMRKWGIEVFIIEPGFAATPMVLSHKQVLHNTVEALPAQVKAEYGDAYFQTMLDPQSLPPVIDPVDLVLDAVQDKVTAKHPALRHRVGRLAKTSFFLTYVLPTRLFDLFFQATARPKLPLPAALMQSR